MNRRALFRVAGAGAVAPVLALADLAGIGRPAPLRRVEAGDVLTARDWNALVDRVNVLSAGGRP